MANALQKITQHKYHLTSMFGDYYYIVLAQTGSLENHDFRQNKCAITQTRSVSVHFKFRCNHIYYCRANDNSF
jgi:hypothetical protein